MHKQGIIHRDLKPENIMFAQDVETNIESEDLLKALNVKIIDLGMSAYYTPNTPLKGKKYLHNQHISLHPFNLLLVPFTVHMLDGSMLCTL